MSRFCGVALTEAIGSTDFGCAAFATLTAAMSYSSAAR
jgi:hypothetical protein